MRLKASFAAAIVATTLATAARPAPTAARSMGDEAHPGTLVRLPDGRRLNFRCMGTGAPTVILEGGWAATSMAWYKVEPLVARRRRVCAYDRAGYGWSDPGPEPRDGAAVARDLDQGLTAAGIGGPLIIVGHSSGGLYARLFADRRPREVVGMVLVDPSVEYQDQRLAAAFGPGAGSVAPLLDRSRKCLAAAERKALPSSDPALAACTPKAQPGASPAVFAARMAAALRPATYRTQISELETLWTRTSDQINAGRSDYGALPLIVLTADNPAGEVWSGLHRQIAERSRRGENVNVAGSSHMMMFDRPDAIVAAIDKVAVEAGYPDRRPGRQ